MGLMLLPLQTRENSPGCVSMEGLNNKQFFLFDIWIGTLFYEICYQHRLIFVENFVE
jgi:hypothetical protein